MVSNGFPNVTTSGQQYNIGEKPSVILYTCINLHAATPKPQSFLSVWEFRTTVVVTWSYMVLEKLNKLMGGNTGEIRIGSERELHQYINHQAGTTKASTRIILTQMYNIFRLLIVVPDYSSESYRENKN